MIYPPLQILAQTDGAIIQKMAEPGFIQWVIYAFIAMMFFERVYSFVNRNKPGRVEMTGSFETSVKASFADAKELEKLRVDVEALREENAAQHQRAGKAGENRVVALSEVLDKETDAIKQRIDTVQEKLTEKLEAGFNSLRDKMDNAALKVAFHDSEIPNLKERIGSLEERYNAAIPKLHDRIDDAMKSRGGKA